MTDGKYWSNEREEGVRRNRDQWWREEDNVIIVGPGERRRGPDPGTDAGNLCSILYIHILRIHILTRAPPSPPLLTLGARHSQGCGRCCSPPGGTQCSSIDMYNNDIGKRFMK
jgi:hypothetical protein